MEKMGTKHLILRHIVDKIRSGFLYAILDYDLLSAANLFLRA